jgi:hypothetical protein
MPVGRAESASASEEPDYATIRFSAVIKVNTPVDLDSI